MQASCGIVSARLTEQVGHVITDCTNASLTASRLLYESSARLQKKQHKQVSGWDRACFEDDRAARAKLEALRWPAGVVCPRCGQGDRVYDLSRIRRELKKCGHCRKQFTILTATIFEASHMPLHKWLLSVHLIEASEKIDIRKLRRTLALSLSAASSVSHQVSRALRLARKRSDGRLAHANEVREDGNSEPIDASESAFDAILTGVLRVKPARKPRAKMPTKSRRRRSQPKRKVVRCR